MKTLMHSAGFLTAAMLLLSSAEAQQLDITVTGTVAYGQDEDTNNIFGFGVSPTAGQPGGTAVGQPVSITFDINLARIAPDVCANNACSEPGHRAYYWTGATGPSWISATNVIGGKNVPNFAPNGGNIQSPAYVQLWTAYGSLPVYNELDIGLSQTVRVIDPTINGTYQEIDSTTSTFLQLTSTVTPFLNGLQPGQIFAWNPHTAGNAASAGIDESIILANCVVGGVCTFESSLLDGEVGVDITKVTVQKVPEPATLALMSLALAGLGLARARLHKPRLAMPSALRRVSEIRPRDARAAAA